ncbi:hypothetical protein Tco_1041745 [Tanacetum coccineum]|uniref:Uncharacterized protein n=1 Tax=Tanacetum coccineum TaxID=301880 RepID=A0ABQ5GH10_9ASTR
MLNEIDSLFGVRAAGCVVPNDVLVGKAKEYVSNTLDHELLIAAELRGCLLADIIFQNHRSKEEGNETLMSRVPKVVENGENDFWATLQLLISGEKDIIRHIFIALDTPTRELLKENNRALKEVNVMFESGKLSRIDDKVVQDQRQRDDNDLQDERQGQPKEE